MSRARKIENISYNSIFIIIYVLISNMTTDSVPENKIIPNNQPLLFIPTREDILGQTTTSTADQKRSQDLNEKYKSQMRKMSSQEAKKIIEDNKLNKSIFNPNIQIYYLPDDIFNVTLCRVFNRCYLELYQLMWYVEIYTNEKDIPHYTTSLVEWGEIIENNSQIIVKTHNSMYMFSFSKCKKMENDMYVCDLEPIKKKMIDQDLTNMNNIYEKIPEKSS